MLRKRLIGVITVRDGWAVQSFGYSRYLPLGKPEVLADNLDRWGADEILVQCIDRSRSRLGPDLALLERISRLGLATPLIYSGGIATPDDAVAAVKSGADRVCIDALLHDDLHLASKLGEPLGAQAVIAALPLVFAEGLKWIDYRTGQANRLPAGLIELLSSGAVSEALVIDYRNEGTPCGFDPRLLQLPARLPLIAFGGLSEAEQIGGVLQRAEVAAVAIGNFLSYREHAVPRFKHALPELPLRPPSLLGIPTI